MRASAVGGLNLTARKAYHSLTTQRRACKGGCRQSSPHDLVTYSGVHPLDSVKVGHIQFGKDWRCCRVLAARPATDGSLQARSVLAQIVCFSREDGHTTISEMVLAATGPWSGLKECSKVFVRVRYDAQMFNVESAKVSFV